MSAPNVTEQPTASPAVRCSDLLCRDIHAAIVSRAEWWRTNPDDSHGINTPVYVAMLEVANAINSVLVFRELERHNDSSSATHAGTNLTPKEKS